MSDVMVSANHIARFYDVISITSDHLNHRFIFIDRIKLNTLHTSSGPKASNDWLFEEKVKRNVTCLFFCVMLNKSKEQNYIFLLSMNSFILLMQELVNVLKLVKWMNAIFFNSTVKNILSELLVSRTIYDWEESRIIASFLFINIFIKISVINVKKYAP